MSRQHHRFLAWTLIASVLITGCNSVEPFYLHEDGDLSHYLDVATDIEYTDVEQPPLEEAVLTIEPRTIIQMGEAQPWDLTLEEAISIALHNAKVIRSLGQVRQFGQIVASPPERLTSGAAGVSTIYDPAIQETGQNGVEQALANFDAVFNFNASWDRQDRPQNIALASAQLFRRDQVTINTELTKRTAVGTQWSFRNVTIYDDTPQFPGTTTQRAVPSDYFTGWEAEFRQPLLRNRGTQVNRVPVILARIQTDISLADFEFSVRGLVSDIERTYWELYFYYRSLAAAKTGRDSALATFQRVNALNIQGAPGGEAQNHARASGEYQFFRSRLQESLSQLLDAERQLRYLMGISPSDGRLIRPADQPTSARVDFEWRHALDESLMRSVELRRQKWLIRQQEIRLIGARNQLLPQLDVVGVYRWLGMGDQFDSENRRGLNFPAAGSTAIDELTEGRFQEHQLQIQSQIPLGFRAQHANLRNAELLVVREQARLEEMELEVVHQLSGAVEESAAQYALAQTNFARWVETYREVEALRVALDAGATTLDILLDAQRRQAEAETAYYQALVQYNIALMMVHFRKGSLLDYNGIVLAEGPWPAKAYYDAYQRARRRDASYFLDYGFSRPKVVSRGPVPQQMGAAATGSMTNPGLPHAGRVMFDTGEPSNSGATNGLQPSNGSTLEPIPADDFRSNPFGERPETINAPNGSEGLEMDGFSDASGVSNVQQSSLEFSTNEGLVLEPPVRGVITEHTGHRGRQHAGRVDASSAAPVVNASNTGVRDRAVSGRTSAVPASHRGTGQDAPRVQLQWRD